MTTGVFPRAAACAVLASAAALAPLAPGAARAQASVVKCVDADGNVTYQDSPCTPGQAGRPLALPKAEAREDTSAWEAAARDARVVKGMPKRWVLKSRGAPAEIRPVNLVSRVARRLSTAASASRSLARSRATIRA